jgi:hypothetical protein
MLRMQSLQTDHPACKQPHKMLQNVAHMMGLSYLVSCVLTSCCPYLCAQHIQKYPQQMTQAPPVSSSKLLRSCHAGW